MRLRMGGPSASLSWDCSGPLPGFRAQGSPGWAGQLLRSHGCPLGAQGRAQHRGLCSQVSKNREPTLLSSSTASLSGVSSGAVWSEPKRSRGTPTGWTGHGERLAQAGWSLPLQLPELQTWQRAWLTKRDPGKVRTWQGEAGNKSSVCLALVSSRVSISRDR